MLLKGNRSQRRRMISLIIFASKVTQLPLTRKWATAFYNELAALMVLVLAGTSMRTVSTSFFID
jgi:hypothetical protein